MLTISELDEAVHIFQNPARHHELGAAALQLPDWFDPDMDPHGPAYRQQVGRLWAEITNRQDYDPLKDEYTPEVADFDAIYRPGFYGTGNAREAGIHLLAMGHILLRSGVQAGSRVLECGAGIGQNALAFARLGAKVDTIDVEPGFCGLVKQAADHYKVDLTPHQLPFGTNPAGEDGAYDLILFYESFHHCFEFDTVIPQLVKMLKPGGRILLAAESVSRTPTAYVPYPWGIGLHWSVVAVMRSRGWMELAFQEPFLVRAFGNHGMTWRFYADNNTEVANIYEFRRWHDAIELSDASLTLADEATWHGAEPAGRWTTNRSVLQLPACPNPIGVDLVNHHPVPRTGRVTIGSHGVDFVIGTGESRTITFPAQPDIHDLQLEITSNVEMGSATDPRLLGIFVERIRPLG